LSSPVEPTPEPVRIAGAINAVVNGVLGVLVALSIALPPTLGGALNVLVLAVAGAGFVLAPIVSSWFVRAQVTPVKAPVIATVAAHFDPPAS
jgi:hypothetical protein